MKLNEKKASEKLEFMKNQVKMHEDIIAEIYENKRNLSFKFKKEMASKEIDTEQKIESLAAQYQVAISGYDTGIKYSMDVIKDLERIIKAMESILEI